LLAARAVTYPFGSFMPTLFAKPGRFNFGHLL
jgi:hypothetical protein